MPLESGKNYVFINKTSGTALDLDTSDNRSVQGWARHGGPNQQWKATAELGAWIIRNVQHGTSLGYEGRNDGNRVICTGPVFGWTLAERSPGVYRISPSARDASGKCVDLAGGNGANGTRVQIWSTVQGNQNQEWEAQKV